MFIRPYYRTKDGKRHAYWALMESYRTERGPRQRVVAYLGQLEEPTAWVSSRRPRAGRGPPEEALRRPAAHVGRGGCQTRTCREPSRDFGGPWLGLELVEPWG